MKKMRYTFGRVVNYQRHGSGLLLARYLKQYGWHHYFSVSTVTWCGAQASPRGISRVDAAV